ncbi:FUSC family protein [Nonomuraea sp. NPDC048916]|uniref:FUSC family protein n=1 Tax=Nonomuraea sp. NPDC048916 TaxID=3154232 RepID=UPI0033CC06B7
MTATTPIEKPGLQVRMPVRAALRLRPLGDIWHKPALSAVVATAIPLLVLLLAGRLDAALYTVAGALCALYGHGLPYATRARTLGLVVLGMLAGTAVALVTSALTDSTALRVAVAALLAGLHKAACDASRIGPPGNVVFTFIAATAVFTPQQLTDVPAHLALGVAGGAVAWLVGMAPSLVSPDGPERIAVARALEAAARLLRVGPAEQDRHQAAHAAAAAVNAAWQTLLRADPAAPRQAALRRLLIRTESAAALPVAPAPDRSAPHAKRHPGHSADSTPDRPAPHAESAQRHAWSAGPPALDADTHAVDAETQAELFAGWALDLRKGRTMPAPAPPFAPDEEAELAGITAERAESAGTTAGRARVLRPVREVARRWRVVMLVAAGSALAGWTSMALGVGRPYWAVVIATAVFATNTTLSWSRALQRVVGNLLGVALFTAVVPLTRLGPLVLIAVVLLMQFLTEWAITRNIWLGSVFLTPMAILMTQFAAGQPVRVLVTDRWLDVCVGAAAGLLVCVLFPDRRANHRVRECVERLERAVADAGLMEVSSAARVRAARHRLTTALVELREAADVAAGEWWSAALPQERIAAAERAGHRTLAELTRWSRIHESGRDGAVHHGSASTE